MGNLKTENLRLCLVSTVKNPGKEFESFLRYHLALGIEKLYIFFDNPKDPAVKVAKKIDGVEVFLNTPALRRKWKANKFFNQNKDWKTRISSRQILNAILARDFAQKEGFDWLFHIDCDELIYSSYNCSLGEVLKIIPPNVKQVICYNYEIVPQGEKVENPFVDVKLFKINLKQIGNLSKIQKKIYRKYFAKPGRFFFFAYSQGKAAIRISPDVFPGVHTGFRRYSRWKRSYISSVSFPGLNVYHYANYSFPVYRRKYSMWKKAADKIGGFHDLSVAAALSGGNKLRELYSRHVEFSDRRGVSELKKIGLFIENKKISKIIKKVLKNSHLKR